MYALKGEFHCLVFGAKQQETPNSAEAFGIHLWAAK